MFKKLLTNIFFLLITSNQFYPLKKACTEIFISSKDTVKYLVVKISLEKDWHIYWINSGDSGMPTEITLELPPGISIQETYWATSKKFESDGLVSYGFENITIILIKLPEYLNSITNNTLVLKINSLICKEVCIPYDTIITFQINDLDIIDDLENYLSINKIHFPKASPNLFLSADTDNEKVILKISNHNFIDKILDIYFYPYISGVFKNLSKQNFYIDNESVKLELPFDPFKTHSPDKVSGILYFKTINSYDEKKIIQESYEISFNINHKQIKE
jgi:thiol:disulfide interchange protein DsbD